jgi:hypothetical protein
MHGVVKKIAATAICKDGINYDQTFESTRATNMGGLREGNTASKDHHVALSGKNTRLLIEIGPTSRLVSKPVQP